jgi:hypothetical protein
MSAAALQRIRAADSRSPRRGSALHRASGTGTGRVARRRTLGGPNVGISTTRMEANYRRRGR